MNIPRLSITSICPTIRKNTIQTHYLHAIYMIIPTAPSRSAYQTRTHTHPRALRKVRPMKCTTRDNEYDEWRNLWRKWKTKYTPKYTIYMHCHYHYYYEGIISIINLHTIHTHTHMNSNSFKRFQKQTMAMNRRTAQFAHESLNLIERNCRVRYQATKAAQTHTHSHIIRTHTTTTLYDITAMHTAMHTANLPLKMVIGRGFFGD